PDSIADWYSANMSWRDILGPHGWRCVSGDGDSDGSQWRHPQATPAVSATIRNGCLFVYSPNTPSEPTEDADPHGYTRFKAYATLDHAGDQSDAARAAREQRDGPTNPSGPSIDELIDFNDGLPRPGQNPQLFWDRPEIAFPLDTL